MNLRYLAYLRLVIEHGSFEAAARAGGVTQPAISHGLQQLQHAVGTPLFTRDGRRRVPTDAALQIARQGREIHAQLAALTTPTTPPAPRDALRVGLTSSAALVCGTLLWRAWCEGRPRRRLDLHSADEGRLLSRLQGGELDLVIAPRPRGWQGSGVASQMLYHITPQVYARPGHPLARARSLAALADAAWAVVGPSVSGPVDVLGEAFTVRRMKPPRIAAACPDYASLLRLMAQADLLAVLPHPSLLESAPPGQIVPLRLREALPLYEMQLFTPRRPRRSVAPVIAALQRLAVPDLAPVR